MAPSLIEILLERVQQDLERLETNVTVWESLGGSNGTLTRALLHIAASRSPDHDERLNDWWDRLSKPQAQSSVRKFCRSLVDNPNPQNPVLDVERIPSNARALVATAQAALLFLAGDTKSWDAACLGLSRSAEALSRSPVPPRRFSAPNGWTQDARALAIQLPDLFSQLADVEPDWPWLKIRIWIQYWLGCEAKPGEEPRGGLPHGIFRLQAPVAFVFGAGGLADLELHRTDSRDRAGKEDLVESPEFALRPYGTALLTAMRRMWNDHSTTNAVWSIRLRHAATVEEPRALTGRSMEAAAAVAFQSLSAGRRMDPQCLIIGELSEDSSQAIDPAGGEEPKLKAAVREGIHSAIVSAGCSLSFALLDELADLRVAVRSVTTLEEVIGFARSNAMPVSWTYALARNRSGLKAASVSVSLFPGDPDSAEVIGHRQLKSIARFAVNDAGALLNSSRWEASEVGRIFRKDYWSEGSRFGKACFEIHGQDWEGSPALRSAMTLAWWIRFFRTILIDALGLPIDFPERWFMAAAGFNSDSGEAQGELRIASALKAIPEERLPSAILLHSGSQSAEIQAMRFPEDLKAVSVKNPSDLVDAFESLLMSESRSLGIAHHLSGMLRRAVLNFVALEEAVAHARWKLLASSGRADYIVQERDLFERLTRLVSDKLANIRSIPSGEPRPPLSSIEEEIEGIKKQTLEGWTPSAEKVKKPSDGFVGQPPVETRVIEEENCKKLRRNIELYLRRDLADERHQDRLPEGMEQTMTWAVAIDRHKKDIVFLRSLEGVFDPLGQRELGTAPALDALPKWFDRIFQLNEAHQRICEAIEEQRDILRELAVPFDASTDSTLQHLEAELRAAEYDYVQEWSNLSRLYDR